MSAVRSSAGGPGRDARRSLVMLAFVPVAVIVGFVVGTMLLGDPNSADSPQRWAAFPRVVLLWAMVEIPSVLGMVWGRRAVRAGDPSGRTGLVVNAVVFAFFTLVTLVGGTVDAFNGV